jgi:hypothetical protein
MKSLTALLWLERTLTDHVVFSLMPGCGIDTATLPDAFWQQ